MSDNGFKDLINKSIFVTDRTCNFDLQRKSLNFENSYPNKLFEAEVKDLKSENTFSKTEVIHTEGSQLQHDPFLEDLIDQQKDLKFKLEKPI